MSQSININGTLMDLSQPKVMGILNITPDSFFSGSRVSHSEEALKKAELMIDQGADILDVGGYSSRPGAEDITEDEELSRVIPVIRTISKEFPNATISIDSFRSKVAAEAIENGAHIINDISGGEADSKMFSTVNELSVPYILMHMKGTPQNMQKNPEYKNVLLDVYKSLSIKVDQLKGIGVADIIVDPGFGFGKSLEHNFNLLQRLEHFQALNCPLLVGFSRKSMIYKSLKTSAENALNGTTVLNTIAVGKGAKILRVHDVKEAKEAVRLYSLTNLT